MLVREALERARQAGVARLDAQLLLSHHLEQPRVWLLAHDDSPLHDAQLTPFLSDVARRAGGLPLAYITGAREFHGLRLAVSPDVLIPRPETEVLVDWALDVLATNASRWPAPAVVDLGTGSGAIGLALKHRRPAIQLLAVDRSEGALAMARHNAETLAIDVECLRSDWWSALAGRKFELAVANPPYVAEGDPHLAALRHEPLDALSPGGDGLGALRTIIEGAGRHLRAGARLLLEHGHDQADAVRTLLQSHRFVDITSRTDLAGLPRCTGGRLDS